MSKKYRIFILSGLWIILSLPCFVFPQNQDSTINSNDNIPKYGYIHFGAGGSMFKLDPGDLNTVYIEPFRVATALNFEYFFYLTAGFRNILQIEYRWGKDGNNLYYDETSFPYGFTIERNTVDMDFDYNQYLLKINPLFFIKSMEAWTVFFLWGNGNVDYLDANNDGFKNGTKNIMGIEVGTIHKYLSISAGFEQNKMVFKELNVKGFVPIIQNFKASYWQLNIKISLGFGL